MWETFKQWDVELFIFLNVIGSENWDPFWIFITQIENWFLLYVLFLFLIFKWYKWRPGWIVAVLTLVSFFLSFGLKYLTKTSVQRLRPNNVPSLAETIRVLQQPMDFSFFSGHASVSFAVTTFMVLSLRKFSKWVYLFFLWPVLFSMSRIYVGVHFPSDIFVGMLIGILLGFVVYGIQKRLKIT